LCKPPTQAAISFIVIASAFWLLSAVFNNGNGSAVDLDLPDVLIEAD
jgi:hypothetical protein